MTVKIGNIYLTKDALTVDTIKSICMFNPSNPSIFSNIKIATGYRRI